MGAVYSEDSSKQHITMMHMVFALLFASAAALPLEDTAEVAAAKEAFQAAFDDATGGGLSAKQAAQIENSYLADAEDVAAARAAFEAAFEDAAAGGLAAKQVAAPVAITAAAPAPYFVSPSSGFSYGVTTLNSLPYAGYTGYAGPVYTGYTGYTGYPAYTGYTGYAAGYPLHYAGLPIVAASPAAEEMETAEAAEE